MIDNIIAPYVFTLCDVEANIVAFFCRKSQALNKHLKTLNFMFETAKLKLMILPRTVFFNRLDPYQTTSCDTFIKLFSTLNSLNISL